MKEYQSDAALMDKLNIVQRNALRLLNLVNQLLDFRKIDVNGYYLGPATPRLEKLLAVLKIRSCSMSMHSQRKDSSPQSQPLS